MPYHAAWQYLRHLDLIKTLGGHASFFLDSFRALASDGKHPRVLLSGAADYSMPAHTHNAYAGENAMLDLSVLDHCETTPTVSATAGSG